MTSPWVNGHLSKLSFRSALTRLRDSFLSLLPLAQPRSRLPVVRNAGISGRTIHAKAVYRCGCRQKISLCLLAASLLSLTQSACNPLARVAELSVAKADHLASSLTSGDPEAGESLEQRVYVDHSLSMAGFVGHQNTEFDQFIDIMPDILPGCRVFNYGRSRGDAPNAPVARQAEFDRHLHDATEYRLGFNPDDVLMGMLANEDRRVFSVIITDGVESDSEGTINTRVVDAIRKWLNAGRTFAVLRIKSLFSGDFYSERARRMVGKVSVPDRPFYAFVFSPGLTEFTDFFAKVRRANQSVEGFVFSPDSLSSTARMPDTYDGYYDAKSPPVKPFYWQMLVRKATNARTEDFSCTFDYTIRPDYPARKLRLQVEATLFRWDHSVNDFQSEGVRLDTSHNSGLLAESTEDRDGMLVEVFSLRPKLLLSPDFSSPYEFYAISQSVKVVDIDEGIVKNSTRDDSDLKNATKTYRFQELITTLVEVHTKDVLGPRICPHFYLTVANG
jgi:hypothetical protein